MRQTFYMFGWSMKESRKPMKVPVSHVTFRHTIVLLDIYAGYKYSQDYRITLVIIHVIYWISFLFYTKNHNEYSYYYREHVLLQNYSCTTLQYFQYQINILLQSIVGIDKYSIIAAIARAMCLRVSLLYFSRHATLRYLIALEMMSHRFD